MLYLDQTQRVLALGDANDDAQAARLINAAQAPAYDRYVSAINKLIDHVEAKARQSSATTRGSITDIRIFGDVMVGVTVLILLGSGFAIAGVDRKLKEDNQSLASEVQERKQVQEQLRSHTALLEAQVHSTIDRDFDSGPRPKDNTPKPAVHRHDENASAHRRRGIR